MVTDARPQLAADKDKLAKATTGQVFTAKQALELGLVDKLGFMEDAVDRAIELAGLDPKNVRVVKYKRQEGLLSGALFGPSDDSQSPLNAPLSSSGFNPAAILDAATPRAYYLFTLLPTLITNQVH